MPSKIWKLQIYFFTAFTTILALVIKKDILLLLIMKMVCIDFQIEIEIMKCFCFNQQWLTSLAFPFCLWSFLHYVGRKLSSQEETKNQMQIFSSSIVKVSTSYVSTYQLFCPYDSWNISYILVMLYNRQNILITRYNSVI